MTDSAYRDHLGRPIVAVTGMGIITSLGQGLKDNWAALSAGTSGIHDDHPLSDRGAFDPHRRHRRFHRHSGPRTPSSAPMPLPARRRSKRLPMPVSRGDFNGPLFLAAPPIEPEWSARFELADRSPPADHPGDAYDRFLAAMRQRPDAAFHEAALFGAISERLADPLRHARPAGHAVDGLCVGGDRDPARHRGDPPGPHRRGRSLLRPTAR